MIALRYAWQAGLLRPQHWRRNILAGAVVGVVALPLAMAFAIASGAKPEQGLYTAIVAGLAVSTFGGTRCQIAGPTGAFIVILSGITAHYGIAGLQVATLLAGLMLVAMGMARLGSVIRFIPDPVIAGFTTGIGVIIWVGQWRDFFGLPAVGGEHFHQKFVLLLQALPHLQWATTGLALFSLFLLVSSPRVLPQVPAPLVATVAATLLSQVLHLQGVATIGSVFGGIPQGLPTLALPALGFAEILRLIGPAFTIALLGAIESLLSAVVADGMAGTRHDANQELIGQGVANLLTPLFGGFAATGAIARTATNIRHGGDSPLAGIVHALTLVLVIVFCAPLAASIPLCALAAVLFVVAYNMSDLPHFWHLLRRAPPPDVAVLLITFVLTVLTDLVLAVNVGVVVSALLFMRRMAQSVEIRAEAVPAQPREALFNSAPLTGDGLVGEVPSGVVVFTIDGPFFFGAAEKLQRTLEAVQSPMHTLVLRIDRVPFIDATGIQALGELLTQCRRRGTRLVLVDLRVNVALKLARAGVLERLGHQHQFSTLGEFLATLSTGGADRPAGVSA